MRVQRTAVWWVLFGAAACTLDPREPQRHVVSKGPAFAGSGRPGALVPLYAYPTSSAFEEIIRAKKRHPEVPVLAVINPGTVGAGMAADLRLVEHTQRLASAGIVVLGYVSLDYGARPVAEIERELANYRSWYPATQGVFFDEMEATEQRQPYHRQLVELAKGRGFPWSAGNPGVRPSTELSGAFDALVIYESPGLPASELLAEVRQDHAEVELAVLSYGISELDESFVASACRNMDYLYLTPDVLDNPWDTLSSYFDALLSVLSRCRDDSAQAG